jgi:hypothetical protein
VWTPSEVRSRSVGEDALLVLILFLLHSNPARVRRAQHKKKSDSAPPGEDEIKSISLHVTFISEQASEVVTEQLLWDLFSRVGEVTDVTINKNDQDQVIEHVQDCPNLLLKAQNLTSYYIYKSILQDGYTQKGYGFVYFEPSERGIATAHRAVQEFHNSIREGVFFTCSFSYRLQKLLSALPSNPAAVEPRGDQRADSASGGHAELNRVMTKEEAQEEEQNQCEGYEEEYSETGETGETDVPADMPAYHVQYPDRHPYPYPYPAHALELAHFSIQQAVFFQEQNIALARVIQLLQPQPYMLQPQPGMAPMTIINAGAGPFYYHAPPPSNPWLRHPAFCNSEQQPQLYDSSDACHGGESFSVSDVSCDGLPEFGENMRRSEGTSRSTESRTTTCGESLQTDEGAMSSDSDGDSRLPSLKDLHSVQKVQKSRTALLLSALRIDTRKPTFI